MALHTQLPIYKVAYGLFDVIMDLAKNMPRDFKASIGGKLRDECIEILQRIQRMAEPEFIGYLQHLARVWSWGRARQLVASAMKRG